MLHHVPSADLQDRILAELRRVLRPDGVLVGAGSVDSPEFRELHEGDTCVPVDPEGLAERLSRAGFTNIEVEVSGPGERRRFRFAARAAAGTN